MKNKIVIAIAVIALVLSGFGLYYPVQTSTVVEKVIGAKPGPDNTEHQFNLAGVTDCGPSMVRATSTVNSAETLLASDLRYSCVIDYTLNVQAATLTLPASSTISDILPKPGMTRVWYIRNATTTATNLTIAGGTGSLLKQATSSDFAGSKIIYGDTDGANFATLRAIRKSNTDIIFAFMPFRD